MPENFQVYCRTINNVEQFIEVDVTLLSDLLEEKPKFLIKIGYDYQSPLFDGVPSSEELVKAEKIKSAIQEFCQKNNSWFVGRISQNGKETFYCYSNEDVKNWQNFTSTNKESYLKLQIDTDPKCDFYLKELYPSDEDWLVTNNIKNFEFYHENGDNGEEVRDITYFFDFPNKTSAEAFLNWAVENDFDELTDSLEEMNEGEYKVIIFRESDLNLPEMNETVLKLYQKAKEFGGEFDNWECEILNSYIHPELGRFISEYKTGSNKHWLAGCCGCFLFLIFGAITLAFIFYQPWDGSRTRWSTSLSFGIAGLICFIACLVLFLRLTWQLHIFEKGLIFKGFRKSRTILWNEVKRYREVKWYSHEYMIETDHQFYLELYKGKKLKLDACFHEIALAVKDIRHFLEPLLMAKAEENLANNRPIKFDKIELSATGLSNGLEKLPWHKIDKIAIEEWNLLTIRKKGEPNPWYKKGVPFFPNAEIFLKLCERYTKG